MKRLATLVAYAFVAVIVVWQVIVPAIYWLWP